ncbi:DedA family protein [Aquisphaera insulae]|uniref:DedA family protein n=1 Tax=Aquisphaera insulae TaxID=2712864 RepID=UPI0013ED4DD0|nr:DedA family protein [Aquisphaera insulae]
MDLLRQFLDILLHLPEYVNQLATQLGPGLYVILFAIIFAETGLVVTPFLPGDSLLFAVGAVAASEGSPINIWGVSALLIVAAVLGDAVNYAAGHYLGPKVFSREDSWLLNRKHLLEAQRFYEQYGGLTIIIARFMPIIRTFAPFVAGIGRMSYPRFALYNITGGVVWVLLFLLGGWWFGAQEVVKKNFHYLIFAIIFISVLPPFIQYAWNLRKGRAGRPAEEAVEAPVQGLKE